MSEICLYGDICDVHASTFVLYENFTVFWDNHGGLCSHLIYFLVCLVVLFHDIYAEYGCVLG